MADGVLSVKDIDAVMSEGLGMRYAFIGMFEAAHLNAEGEPVIKNYLYIIIKRSFAMGMQFTTYLCNISYRNEEIL